MSKRITRKRKLEKAEAKQVESKSDKTSVIAVGSALVFIAVLFTYFVLQPIIVPDRFTGWDWKWQMLPNSNSYARTVDEAREAYAFAARHPEVTDLLPCVYECADKRQHKNVTDCFIEGWTIERQPKWEATGVSCPFGIDMARDSAQMLRKGQTVAAIRLEMNNKYKKDKHGTQSSHGSDSGVKVQ